MKFKYRVYRGDKNHRHHDAHFLSNSQKELVFEAEIEAANGAIASAELDKMIDIKSRWQIVRELIER